MRKLTTTAFNARQVARYTNGHSERSSATSSPSTGGGATASSWRPSSSATCTWGDLVTTGRIRYVGFSVTPAWFTAKAHTAISAAFTGDVTLYGKADTGDADPTIRQELKPGTYPITAHRGANHTVQGQIAVTANVPSAGHQQNRRTADYWLLASTALILAAIAGAVLLRRRGRG